MWSHDSNFPHFCLILDGKYQVALRKYHETPTKIPAGGIQGRFWGWEGGGGGLFKLWAISQDSCSSTCFLSNHQQTGIYVRLQTACRFEALVRLELKDQSALKCETWWPCRSLNARTEFWQEGLEVNALSWDWCMYAATVAADPRHQLHGRRSWQGLKPTSGPALPGAGSAAPDAHWSPDRSQSICRLTRQGKAQNSA